MVRVECIVLFETRHEMSAPLTGTLWEFSRLKANETTSNTWLLLCFSVTRAVAQHTLAASMGLLNLTHAHVALAELVK